MYIHILYYSVTCYNRSTSGVGFPFTSVILTCEAGPPGNPGTKTVGPSQKLHGCASSHKFQEIMRWYETPCGTSAVKYQHSTSAKMFCSLFS